MKFMIAGLFCVVVIFAQMCASAVRLGTILLPLEMRRNTNEMFSKKDASAPLAMPPPDEMTRKEIQSGDVIENDITVDDRLISIIQGAKVGNTKRGAIYGDRFRWEKTVKNGKQIVIVPYKLEASVRKELDRAIAAFNEKTCIRFAPRKNERDYLRIYSGPDCRSTIGRRFGSQDLSLGTNCNHMGTIIHELMHALGFLHEQSRKDRNKYVQVKANNIKAAHLSEYNTYVQDNQGIPFDLHSILLYQTMTASQNDRPTMVKIGDPTGRVELGNKDYFSAKDLLRINKLYGCSEQNIDNADYEVVMETSSSYGAGTDDYVYINLIGASGQTSGFSSVGTGEGFNDFERGMTQTFTVVFKYVGPIAKIQVYLGGGKWFASWKLKSVTIKDPRTNIRYRFRYNKWIDDGETKTITSS